jgi:hypothetical protein
MHWVEAEGISQRLDKRLYLGFVFLYLMLVIQALQ